MSKDVTFFTVGLKLVSKISSRLPASCLAKARSSNGINSISSLNNLLSFNIVLTVDLSMLNAPILLTIPSTSFCDNNLLPFFNVFFTSANTFSSCFTVSVIFNSCIAFLPIFKASSDDIVLRIFGATLPNSLSKFPKSNIS